MIANILDWIVLGLQFGLLAAGLTLVYGLGGVLNLAYGQMAVVSAMVVVFAMDAGVPAFPAVLLGLVAGGLFGLLLDLTILRPVYRLHGEARVLLSLLLTLGVAFTRRWRSSGGLGSMPSRFDARRDCPFRYD